MVRKSGSALTSLKVEEPPALNNISSGPRDNIVLDLESAIWRKMFTLAGYGGHHNSFGGTESLQSVHKSEFDS